MSKTDTNNDHGAPSRAAGSLKPGPVGVVLGLLIGALALFLGLEMGRYFGSGVVMIVAGLMVLGTAVIVVTQWDRSDRSRRRPLAIGLSAGTSLAIVSAVAWGVLTGFDPFAMSQRQIDSALVRIHGAHREAFYLGNEADGQHLEEISALPPPD